MNLRDDLTPTKPKPTKYKQVTSGDKYDKQCCYMAIEPKGYVHMLILVQIPGERDISYIWQPVGNHTPSISNLNVDALLASTLSMSNIVILKLDITECGERQHLAAHIIQHSKDIYNEFKR